MIDICPELTPSVYLLSYYFKLTAMIICLCVCLCVCLSVCLSVCLFFDKTRSITHSLFVLFVYIGIFCLFVWKLPQFGHSNSLVWSDTQRLTNLLHTFKMSMSLEWRLYALRLLNWLRVLPSEAVWPELRWLFNKAFSRTYRQAHLYEPDPKQHAS